MLAVQQQMQPVYGESALIPKERYTSRDWLQLEYQRLWPRVWQMACRLEEIPNVGDYVEYTKEWHPDWRAHEWGAVVEQDLANMGHVQRGMHESTYPGLRLGRQEVGLRNFHRFLDRYLL